MPSRAPPSSLPPPGQRFHWGSDKGATKRREPGLRHPARLPVPASPRAGGLSPPASVGKSRQDFGCRLVQEVKGSARTRCCPALVFAALSSRGDVTPPPAATRVCREGQWPSSRGDEDGRTTPPTPWPGLANLSHALFYAAGLCPAAPRRKGARPRQRRPRSWAGPGATPSPARGLC